MYCPKILLAYNSTYSILTLIQLACNSLFFICKFKYNILLEVKMILMSDFMDIISLELDLRLNVQYFH